MSDDERPRKSWREIDKARDGSRERRDDRPSTTGRGKAAQRNQSYRAALDKLFDTGKIADLVEQKVGPEAAGSGGGNRIKMQAAIRDAVDAQAVAEAVEAYVARFEQLPDDLEIWGRVLEHRDPARQLEAMTRIETLLDDQSPKRTRAMVGQLKMIRDVSGDPEMEQLAVRLIELLE